MPDEVGGIQAQVTADIGPFLSGLQKAEAAAKEFDSRYGKINVVITATLRMPTQTAIREYQRDLQRAIAAEAPPRVVPTPTTAAPVAPTGRGAVPAPTPVPITRGTTPTAVAAELAVGVPVAARPSAADVAAKNASAKAIAQASANRRGTNAQWTEQPSGVIHTIHPERAGGEVGTGGGAGISPISAGGVGRTGVGGFISGPREFVGGRRTGGVGGTDDFQGIVEELGRVTAENERLRTQTEQPAGGRRPLSAAQLAQRAAARANVVQEPGTGLFINRDVLAARAIQPEIQRPAGVEAFAAEVKESREERARMVALSRSLGGGVAVDLTGFSPEAIRNQMRQVMQAMPDVFGQYFQEAMTEMEAPAIGLQTGRARLTEARRTELIGIDPELARAQTLFRQSRELISAAQTGISVRNLGPALAGMIQTAGGRPASAIDIREATQATNAGEVALSNYLATTDQLELKTKEFNQTQDTNTKRREELAQEVEGLTQKQTRYRSEVEASTQSVTEHGKALAEMNGPLRSVVAGFAGGIGASLAFGVGITAITGAVGLMEKALGPVIERANGYQNVMAKITGTLSDQTIAEHGLVDVVVAEALARSRLNATTAAFIAPLLAERSATEASNKAFSEQLDVYNSAIAVRRQNAQFGGFDRGLFQTTGGLNVFGLQTPIGGVPSTQELVGRQLTQVTPRLQEPFGQELFRTLTFGLGPLLSGDTRVPIEEFAAALEEARPTVEYLNSQLAKGGESAVRFSLNADKASDAVVRAQVSLLEQAGAPDIAAAIRDSAGRITLTGLPANQFDAVNALRRGIQALSFANQREDAELVLTRLREQVIPARLFQLTRQSELQRGLIGIQAGVQRAAQPFLPPGVTVPPAGAPGTGIPGGLGAVSPELRGALGVARGIDRLNVQRIEAARVEIGNLALPGQRAGALASFDRLQGLGQQAAGLQTFVTQSQVTLATAQYAEQLRQARLSLGDLAVLSGRVASAGGDNLGVLQKQTIQYERQNSLLQIQLSTLQLELQQRQINFQVAIAGFTAPGVTGAERAARIEQAELEASFAQEQLNIQKQILQNQAQSVPLQIQIQDIQFQRDYISARNAIDLLTQGRQVTIDVAAAQEALQRINAEIEVETANLQTFIQAGAQAAASLIADQAKFIETYTTATQDLQTSAAAFFEGVSNSYSKGLIDYLTDVATFSQNFFSRYQPTGGGRHTAAAAQTGFYGSVGQPTSITVGEAGAETVAILRNPREMMWGGGGGTSINLTITVTGNTVRSDQDLETLSTVVARKVEEAISRRTSLLGFRP